MRLADAGVVYSAKGKVGMHVVQEKLVDHGSTCARFAQNAVGPRFSMAHNRQNQGLWAGIYLSQGVFNARVGEYRQNRPKNFAAAHLNVFWGIPD